MSDSMPYSECEAKSINIDYEWMIRPCEMYKEEYSDCTSIKGRFHQYFIFGQSLNCVQWKKDFDNCLKWKEDADAKAAKQIINSEKDRRRERLGAHYANNTWEKRDSAPDDWNKPLPEYISLDYEHSYLGLKAKELQGDGDVNPQSLKNRNACILM